MENEICVRELWENREIPATLELRENKLTGYAIVFNQKSHVLKERGKTFREIIAPGAFTESIQSSNITFQFLHNDTAIYGDTRSGSLTIEEDEIGYKFSLNVPEYASLLKAEIESGNIKGMSFGFRPTKENWSEDGIRTILKGTIDHIAAVYSPAYPQTSIEIREDTVAKNEYEMRKKRLEVSEREIF